MSKRAPEGTVYSRRWQQQDVHWCKQLLMVTQYTEANLLVTYVDMLMPLSDLLLDLVT